MIVVSTRYVTGCTGVKTFHSRVFLKSEINKSIDGVIKSGSFILGKPVAELEEKLALTKGVGIGTGIGYGCKLGVEEP